MYLSRKVLKSLDKGLDYYLVIKSDSGCYLKISDFYDHPREGFEEDTTNFYWVDKQSKASAIDSRFEAAAIIAEVRRFARCEVRVVKVRRGW